MNSFISEVLLPTVLIAIVCFGSVIGMAWLVTYIHCSSFAEGTGYPTKQVKLSCYAQVDGKWVPKNYVFGRANEIRIQQGAK